MKRVLMTGAFLAGVALLDSAPARAQSDSPPILAPDEVAPLPHKVKGDIDGDGRSNIILLQAKPDDCHIQDMHTSFHKDFIMDGRVATEGQELPPGPWQISATGDFNGDGRPDLFWQRLVEGPHQERAAHEGTTRVGVTLTLAEAPNRYPDPPKEDDGIPMPEGAWTLVGTGDFGGIGPGHPESLAPPDGKDDLLWRDDDTGDLSIWLSDDAGFARAYRHAVSDHPGATNIAVAVAHLFAEEVRPQIVFQDRTTGLLTYWTLEGVSRTTAGELNPNHATDPNWSIVGAGDFDGDGYDDLLWRNDNRVWGGNDEETPPSWKLVIWFMSGLNRRDGGFVNTPNSGTYYSLLGAVDDGCQYSQISGPR